MVEAEFDAPSGIEITSISGEFSEPGRAEKLVNGKPDVTLPVATRAYRLRFLNGSNSRIYKLGWEDGAPFTVIGTSWACWPFCLSVMPSHY
jgi:hypothetical protein